jgi:hypothetical protein
MCNTYWQGLAKQAQKVRRVEVEDFASSEQLELQHVLGAGKVRSSAASAHAVWLVHLVYFSLGWMGLAT